MTVFVDASVQQATVAEDFYEMYESKHELYNGALKNQDIAKVHDTARLQFVNSNNGFTTCVELPF
jgi:hypothetical protein